MMILLSVDLLVGLGNIGVFWVEFTLGQMTCPSMNK